MIARKRDSIIVQYSHLGKIDDAAEHVAVHADAGVLVRRLRHGLQSRLCRRADRGMAGMDGIGRRCGELQHAARDLRPPDPIALPGIRVSGDDSFDPSGHAGAKKGLEPRGAGIRDRVRRAHQHQLLRAALIALQMYWHPLIWIAALWAVTFPGATWAVALLFRRARMDATEAQALAAA